MKKDFFDLLMEKQCFRVLNPFYKRHKEVLLYLFFGGLSFLVNVGSFIILNKSLSLNELVANVISWIITVLFVYVTNKLWVFKVDVKTKKGVIFQILSFFTGRIGTLFLEEAILFVFITKMELNSTIVKIVAQIIVIVANYVISKLVVFRSEGNDKKSN